MRQRGLALPYYPPHTVGDVGLTQYVQAVNGAIDLFNFAGGSTYHGVAALALERSQMINSQSGPRWCSSTSRMCRHCRSARCPPTRTA